MQGAQETTLTAEATLATTTHRQAWSRPPIELDFSGRKCNTRNAVQTDLSVVPATVVMFTASGLLVRFLKVFERSNYQSVKWVRYMTKSKGTYQIRVSLRGGLKCWRRAGG